MNALKPKFFGGYNIFEIVVDKNRVFSDYIISIQEHFKDFSIGLNYLLISGNNDTIK